MTPFVTPLQQLHYDISEDLERIAKRFKGRPKITLIVRNPELADGDVLISDDDFEQAIAAIRRLKDREPVVQGQTCHLP
jgi:hypothetical protein